jgi:hypothetical protein
MHASGGDEFGRERDAIDLEKRRSVRTSPQRKVIERLYAADL